eukprot:3769418-Rhodomonas_salina.4
MGHTRAPSHFRQGRRHTTRPGHRTYTPKSNTRNRLVSTICTKNAVSCIRFRGVPFQPFAAWLQIAFPRAPNHLVGCVQPAASDERRAIRALGSDRARETSEHLGRSMAVEGGLAEASLHAELAVQASGGGVVRARLAGRKLLRPRTLSVGVGRAGLARLSPRE